MSPVIVRHRAALARFHGARTEQQNEFGIFSGRKRGAAGLLAAVHIRSDAGNLRRGIAVVEVQITADQAKHTIERTRSGGGNARGIRNVHGLVAVSVNDLFELGSSRIDGLLPADALELALAALADALHGIAQAVGMRQPATIRAAAQASTRLRIVETGILARKGIDPGNLVVFHMKFQRATTRAVDCTMAPGDLLLRVGKRSRNLAKHGVSARSAAGGHGQSAKSARRLQERTTAHGMRVRGHFSPFFQTSIQHRTSYGIATARNFAPRTRKQAATTALACGGAGSWSRPRPAFRILSENRRKHVLSMPPKSTV